MPESRTSDYLLHHPEAPEPHKAVSISEAVDWLLNQRPTVYVPEYYDESGQPLFEITYQPTSFDNEKHYREFELTGRPSVADLKALIAIPYEVAITEQHGKLFLSTGLKHSIPNHEGHFARRMREKEQSRIFFHTHPSSRSDEQGEIHVNLPSLADVMYLGTLDKKTICPIASRKGLVQFQRPTIDPLTKKRLGKDDEPKHVLHSFLNDRKLITGHFFADELRGDNEPGWRRWGDLSMRERFEITDEFVRESGMIVQEADWDDEEGTKKISDLFIL